MIIIIFVFFISKINPIILYNTFIPARPLSENVVNFTNFFNLKNIGFLFFMLLLTAILGQVLLNSLFNDLKNKFNIVEGFWFGYLIILFPFRLASFILPMPVSKLTTILIVISLILIYGNKNEINLCKIITFKKIMLSIVFFMTIIIIFIQQIKQGEFNWVGHGTNQYQWFTKEFINFKYPKRIPVFDQHSDDWLITLLFTSIGPIDFDPIIVTAIVLSIIKVSSFLFFVKIFYKLNINKFRAVVSTIFLFFGTWNLIPTYYSLYFDSSNPLFFVVHSGRIVGINLIILLITLFYRNDNFFNPTLKNVIVLVLVFTGISQTSISNSFNIFFILLILLIMYYLFINKTKIKMLNINLILIFFLLSGLSFSPDLVNFKFNKPGIFFIPIILYSIFYLILIWVNYKKVLFFNLLSQYRMLWIFALTTFFSVSLLGNIFADNSLNHFFVRTLNLVGAYIPNLNTYSPTDFGPPCCGGSAVVISGGVEFLKLSNVFVPKQNIDGIFFVDIREMGIYSQYSNNLINYLMHYSLFIIFLYILKIILAKKYYLQKYFINFLTIIFSWILLNIFHTNYINDSTRSWTKTRFLEIPIYLICFIFLFLLSRLIKTNFFHIVILIWIVVPLYNSKLLEQIKMNYTFLVDLLKYFSG